MPAAFHTGNAFPGSGSMARSCSPVVGRSGAVRANIAPVTHAAPRNYTPAFPAIIPLPSRLGWHQYSWRRDLYYRIWVIPSEMNLGLIPSDSSYVVTLWNAFFHAVRLDSVTLSGDSGSRVVGQQPGDIIFPLAGVQWRLLVSATGAPVVSGQVVWVYDGMSALFRFRGMRAALWPFPHNWAEPMEEKIEFKTSVWQTWKGYETRRALRRYPRRSVTMSVLAPPERHYVLAATLSAGLDQTFVFPDPVRRGFLAFPGRAGDRTIEIAGPPRWLSEKAVVFLQAGGPETLDSYYIAAVTGNTATIEPTLVRDYPPGTMVFYGISGRIAVKGAKTRHHIAAAATGRIDFECEPGFDLRTEYDFPEWDGLPLFDVQPNWASEPEGEWKSLRLEADYGLGRRNWINPVEWHDYIMRFRYTELSRESAFRVIDFFRGRRGRALPFWVPSWTADLPKIFPVTAGSSSIKVPGHDFGRAYKDSLLHRAIRIRLRDGTALYRRVTGMTLISDSSGNSTIISIDPPVDRNLHPEDIVYVSWVFFARFAQDSLTVRWITDQVADMTLGILRLPENGGTP